MQILIDIVENRFNRLKEGKISHGCIAEKMILKAVKEGVPIVTPIRPKGHWIKYDKEYFTADRLTPVIHSIRECSECHTKISDFCGEMKYCPNCGVDMREVEE